MSAEFNDAATTGDAPDRVEINLEYREALEFEPYPFQNAAMDAWVESKHGLLVCAPTGTGKTLIAEAGLYEALRLGKRAYYTTPLIALTEQKYAEIQEAAERWGFDRSDVGLVTGNRRENVDAKILVVVAEILFNRLLSSDAFGDFAQRCASNAVPQPEKNAENDDSPTISAAELNAKRSVAVSWKDLEKTPAPKSNDDDKKQNLPEIPDDPSDFEDPDENRDPEDAYFSFDDVAVVVMDEFHQFSDPERGVVWEFALALLPLHVRTLLISATVGNAEEFVAWLRLTAGRSLSLYKYNERKVPLVYQWVEDRLLAEQLEDMCKGDEDQRLTPALVFCFNRDECWDRAEIAKGKNVVDSERQKIIAEQLEEYDLKSGAGPKLRQLLLRGVGVHHAGILPKYRRIVESLFQQKLLSFCFCTETLAAGINLPARSVVLPTLLKGPAGAKRLVDASTAHQIFGRAGRPQYDSQGFVFALAHEDDVKIARSREKYDQIPDDVKDPKLREMKKKLKKKILSRNPNETYWSEKQFEALQNASPGKLLSRGPLPWRLLAHMIECNSDVKPARELVARRLVSPKLREKMSRALDAMLLSLWRGGFVRLAPRPERYGIPATAESQAELARRWTELKEKERRRRPFGFGVFEIDSLDEVGGDHFTLESFEKDRKRILEDDELPDGFDFFGGDDLFDLQDANEKATNHENADEKKEDPKTPENHADNEPAKPNKPEFDFDAISPEMRDQYAAHYRAKFAYPTPKLKILTSLRGVNQVYGAFLLEQLGAADRAERIQAFESLLEMPSTVARALRPPKYDELPPGKLATARLDKELLQRGLASIEELVPRTEEEEREERENRRHFGGWREERVYVVSFAEKLRRLFEDQYPGVMVRVDPVWAAGELMLDYNGDFEKFVVSKRLHRQEGVVFRHLLRLILLLEEFEPLKPVEGDPREWRADLRDLGARLVATCRAVDPSSVEETLRSSGKTDLLNQS